VDSATYDMVVLCGADDQPTFRPPQYLIYEVEVSFVGEMMV
jgi:hypothetical protein